MSIHFHPLTIREIRKETPDCISVSLEVPQQLQEQFAYTQGQSLTLRTRIAGEEVRRTYSLCSSPLDKEWRIAVKRIDGGIFSAFAHEQLKAGDTLEVMPPIGRFYTQLNADHKKNYLAIAAGSGITPVLSIIATTLAIETGSTFTLIYGNRSRNSIIFFELLEGLKNKYVDRFTLIHVLSRERTETPLNFGRINAEKLQELARLVDFSSFDECFVCGPEQMIFTAKDFLQAQGLPEKKIHFELFTTPGQKTTTATKPEQQRETGPASAITVRLDGRSFDFKLPLNSSTSLLDAALAEGADLPYACKGGVCCTCKARLLEGEVEMDVHWGLEHEEIEQGYILTCQSHPKSEKIVVDFDIK